MMKLVGQFIAIEYDPEEELLKRAILEKFHKNFEQQVIEVVAIVRGWQGTFPQDDYKVMQSPLLGMMFCKTGELTTQPANLVWPVTEGEVQGDMVWELFRKDQICRLKVRPMKESCREKSQITSWCFEEIVAYDVKCPELEAALRKMKEPRSIEHFLLGTLTRKWDSTSFDTHVHWLGVPIVMRLRVDDERGETCDNAAAVAAQLYVKREEFDKSMRTLAAARLTSEANEWESQYYGYAGSLTATEFASRLRIEEITAFPDGTFQAVFDADGMFDYCRVLVDGDVESGPRYAFVMN